MQPYFFYLLFFIISSVSYSQTKLEGTVTDAITHEPLSSVVISTSNSADLNSFKDIAQTNSEGKYQIKLPDGTASFGSFAFWFCFFYQQ